MADPSLPRTEQAVEPSRWPRGYTRAELGADAVAGAVTAMVLMPQAFAFAQLAGLPPQHGLYAAIVPPLVYALLGSSRTLSVGPVSIASIMVAQALAHMEGSAAGSAALMLAFMVGSLLLAMAVLRLGNLINFVSHPVLTGFMAGAALLIIGSQLPNLAGISGFDCGTTEPAPACTRRLIELTTNETLLVGLLSLIVLMMARRSGGALLQQGRLPGAYRIGIARMAPLLVLAVAALAATAMRTVPTVGPLPSGLASFSFGFLDQPRWLDLLPSAFFIALVAYVESIAIAKVTANIRRQRVAADRELVALGASNVIAAFAGAMPVAGSLSRTMVNFAAGARTQFAGVIAAVLIASAALFLAAWVAKIPNAALAAIIIVAVMPLLDVQRMSSTWRYDRGDGLAMVFTLAGVLVLGIEHGLAFGVVVALLTHSWRTGHPHIAVVGRVPGTEHFRNVRRHAVETWPELLLVRIDESLSFAGCVWIEDFLNAEVARHRRARHLVLVCSAVNYIDGTGLEFLERTVDTLRVAGITVHLAEVKGPVMDRLQNTPLLRTLAPGEIFLSTEAAIAKLTPPPSLQAP